MDGREVSSISDCVGKLKKLDSKGRVWSQEMILELQGGYVVLSDIETKVWQHFFFQYIIRSLPFVCSPQTQLSITYYYC